MMGEISTLGRRLRHFRQQKGLSQNELAKRANVARVVITRLENGQQRGMDIEAIIRVADVLALSVDRLVRADIAETAPALA